MASTWKTSGSGMRLPEGGTLVGMPSMGDGFDALHPERWSHPPPPGVSPIIPYEGPEGDASAELESPWKRPEEAPLPRLPMRRVMPREERRLLAAMALLAGIVVGIVALLVALFAR